MGPTPGSILHDYWTKQERCADKYESRENIWRKSTINNSKKLKYD